MAVVGACVLAWLAWLAALGALGAGAQAPAVDETLRLGGGGLEVGWVSLTLGGPPGAAVEVSEQVGDRRVPVARVTLDAHSGTGALNRALPWRCDRRVRRFVAASVDAAGAATAAAATITTPSCKDRLRLLVAPARLAPGRSANVRVGDSWGLGGVGATACAKAGAVRAVCEPVRLAPGQRRLRTGLRLAAAGRWTVTLRSTHGQRISRGVTVRRGTKLRVLVTGDSMVYGIWEVLKSQFTGRHGSVMGDAHPASGITRPTLDWPAHARRTARSKRPDATIVMLGAADDSLPLTAPSGAVAQCCGPAWQEQYSRRVRAMMATYLRSGHGFVYWVQLPVPRKPERLAEFQAIHSAVRDAAAGFDDGVRVVDEVADVIAPHDRFTASIVYGGKRRLVRDPDGVHLSREGVHIAVATLVRVLRAEGMVQ